jgi:hypothetical protein
VVAWNKETLKSGGLTKTKKKKKTSQTKQRVEVEVDDLEICKIINHKTNKQGKVRVEVKWDNSGNTDWQYLYDTWADYPGEVEEYKKKKKCKENFGRLQTLMICEHFMCIVGMLGGAKEVIEAKLIVLANNR